MAEKPHKPASRKPAAKSAAKPGGKADGGKKPSAPKRGQGEWKGQAAYRTGKRKPNTRVADPLLALPRGRRNWAMLIARLVIGGMIVAGLAVVYFTSTLPDIRAIDTIKKQQGITVETADGRVIANYGDVYGSYIPYDKLPKTLVQAVIATEDRRFFVHHGVDFWGIARAMVTNIAHGHVVQGGSTVTQQVAKNVFLTPERSLKRKIQEVLLAFWLEGRFSKKEIMAIYLNRVYLGSGTFGIDAAAHRYFNKSATELNLYESALMAGLLKAPSRYSPAANAERSRERVHQVLLNMVDAGFLKENAVKPTMEGYVKLAGHETSSGGDVRYFADWVVDEIPNTIGEVNEDLIVTTTMDTRLQGAASDALQDVISTQGQGKNVSQGALVAMTPDGAVKALVGGLNYSESQYNRAAQAKRQPGSSFKIFVYLAALEAGYTPQTTVTDAPIAMQVGNKSWTPENNERNEYRGDIPLVEALRYSLNTVSVRLSQSVGIARVAQMAERLGLPNIPAYPSIALGAVEATLLDMTGAFAHLPNRGNRVTPYGIVRIRTVKGNELFKREEPQPESLLSESVVNQMNYMLVDAATRGTGSKAALKGYQSAGKTGTSSDFKDAWFIGFTNQLVAGVWVGNDDNKSMKKVYGGTIPALVWHEFMLRAMDGIPAKPIPTDAGSSGIGGLLPWLFGGSGAPSSAPAPTGASQGVEEPPAGAPQQNSPAGGALNAVPQTPPLFTNPAAAPTAPVPTPASNVYAPAAQPANAAPAATTPSPTPAPSGEGDVLTPQFWHQLMKEAPKKLKEQPVEYTYPGAKR
ncbi:MAG: transglycosylase domain-containing protein [Rickettsiales bacterium]